MSVIARGQITLTLVEDGKDAAVRSETPLDDKTQLWYDTIANRLKYWNGTEWVSVNDQSEEIEAVEKTLRSSIDQTRSEIDLSVSEMNETLSSSLEQISGLQTQLKLTAENASIIKTTVERITDVVNGKVDDATIKEWARFNGAELELGASNSPFKAVLSTTELAFWQGTNKVAWISNNEMHIANSIIMEILKVGNWVCRDEGIAGLTWRRV